MILRTVVAVLGVNLLSSCAAFECGYGGPGCGTPGFRICEGPFIVGRSYSALATFFDDTGPHPAKITSSSSATPQIISVTAGATTGRLELAALARGEGRVTLQLEGWEGKSFTWAMDVSADGGVARDGGQFPPTIPGVLADGGSCVAESLSLVR